MKNRVIICQTTIYKKPQKLPFFRPKDSFMTKTPCFLGSKLEVFMTNSYSAECTIRVYRIQAFECRTAMNVLPNTSRRGIEPIAQGNTLGNKGNITGCALKGQKRFLWKGNAYAPPERNHHTVYNTQGSALGYLIAGLPGRLSPFQRSNSAAGDSIHTMTLKASALNNQRSEVSPDSSAGSRAFVMPMMEEQIRGG